LIPNSPTSGIKVDLHFNEVIKIFMKNTEKKGRSINPDKRHRKRKSPLPWTGNGLFKWLRGSDFPSKADQPPAGNHVFDKFGIVSIIN
jgi:hypothetical protein